jgi:16S rRNA (uracil1498-N3)-methyltransferase
MHLFYIEDTAWIDYQSGHILLQGDEAFHAFKVLRMKVGDESNATDGEGNWFTTSVVEIGKKQCLLKITAHFANREKRSYRIHLAVAPTKNISRFEWFLEKATEMGIDEITPIITAHSERREIKIERSNKIITAAVKQSLKAYHPKLNEAVKFKDFLAQPNEAQKFIAHLINEDQLGLKQAYDKHRDVCILIGPEGDFSAEEIEQAQKAGFVAVQMGKARLRTETAAVVAVNTIHFVND